jgi:hypothetical protein
MRAAGRGSSFFSRRTDGPHNARAALKLDPDDRVQLAIDDTGPRIAAPAVVEVKRVQLCEETHWKIQRITMPIGWIVTVTPIIERPSTTTRGST